MDRRSRHPINDADPRDILNQIKKFQPNFGDVPQYGGDPVRIGMGSMTGNSMGLMGNMGFGNVPVTTSYGLPLQYPQASMAASMQGSGNSDDPLRNSFARCVKFSSDIMILLKNDNSHLVHFDSKFLSIC